MTALMALALALPPGNARAQDLSGQWQGSVTCNGQYAEVTPWQLTITLTPSGGSSYALAASFLNGSGSGSVKGANVSWTAGNFLNTLTATGTVANGHMSGQYTQSMGPTCSWHADKVGGFETDVTPSEPAKRAPAAAPEPSKDGMGVDCKQRQKMIDAEVTEAVEKTTDLIGLAADCKLDRVNLAKSINALGGSIQTQARYFSKCSPVLAAQFKKRGERFFTMGQKIITTCAQ